MHRMHVLGAVLTAVLALGNCDGELPTSPSSAGTSPAPMGRLTIHLTDDPLDDVQEVHVWITGISTEPRGGAVVDFDTELGDVELLSLRNRSVEVVNTEVPSGFYEYVAFRIDESRSYIVESGLRRPLAVPDGDARVPGPFHVISGATTTLTMDFDAEASLSRHRDGGWILEPVVIVEVMTNQ